MAGRHAADHPPKKFHNAEWRNFLGFPLTPPSLTHYVPDAPQQTPETLNAIMLLITVIPAAGSIITSLLFLFFYKLDTRMMNEIQTDLKANHYPA